MKKPKDVFVQVDAFRLVVTRRQAENAGVWEYTWTLRSWYFRALIKKRGPKKWDWTLSSITRNFIARGQEETRVRAMTSAVGASAGTVGAIRPVKV